jgi:hypothetical protein
VSICLASRHFTLSRHSGVTPAIRVGDDVTCAPSLHRPHVAGQFLITSAGAVHPE